MRQAGLKPDKHAANAAVARWLREVANPRVHATTDEIPAERLVIEAQKLQPLPTPYAGRSIRSLCANHHRSAKPSLATSIRSANDLLGFGLQELWRGSQPRFWQAS
jgi:hypothetical protein